MSKYELLKFIFTLFSLKLSKIIRKLGRESGNIMELKGIETGISNFKTIIEKDRYYFDKTKFIEDILKDGLVIKLFTRPRRFRKRSKKWTNADKRKTI